MIRFFFNPRHEAMTRLDELGTDIEKCRKDASDGLKTVEAVTEILSRCGSLTPDLEKKLYDLEVLLESVKDDLGGDGLRAIESASSVIEGPDEEPDGARPWGGPKSTYDYQSPWGMGA